MWKVTDRIASRFAFVSDAEIEGLVVNLADPLKPRHVDIKINGHDFGAQFACGVADIAELEFIGPEAFAEVRRLIGDAHAVAAKVRFELPPYVAEAAQHHFLVIDRESRTVLLDEKRTLREEFNAHLARVLRGVMRGRVQVVNVEARRITFGGAFVVMGDESGVTATGQSTTSFQFQRTVTSDHGDFAILPGSRCFAINGIAEVGDSEATIALSDSTGALTIPPATALLISADFRQELGEWAYPEPFRMTRTMGFAADLSYYFDGYQTFRLLESVLRETTARGLSDYRSILDWGCGCGRVTQHLLKHVPSKIYGADIDTDSLAWCRANLPDGVFVPAGLSPPLDLPDRSLDLVIGVSVLTHLDEATHHAWLVELGRLLAPDGIALLTIMSEQALFNRWVTAVAYRDFVKRGISDTTRGSLLRGVADHNYYRETYHTHDYVLRNWARYFDVLAIKRAAHSNFQDMVVLRKRAEIAAPKLGF